MSIIKIIGILVVLNINSDEVMVYQIPIDFKTPNECIEFVAEAAFKINLHKDVNQVMDSFCIRTPPFTPLL